MQKSRREVLRTALIAALASATPQSRLLAASRGGPVRLPLKGGNILEVTPDKVVEVAGGRRKLADGKYQLESGGWVEVGNGVLVGASTSSGPVHAEVVWIEFADEKKDKKARVAARKFLVSDREASLFHAGTR